MRRRDLLAVLLIVTVMQQRVKAQAQPSGKVYRIATLLHGWAVWTH